MPGAATFVEYKGKKILNLDFSHCELEDVVRIVRECKKLITAEPPNSILTLTDVTDLRNNSAVARVLKEFTSFNKPYVKAGAVVGLDSLRKAVYEVIVKFSGRNLSVFENMEEARDWLTQQ